MNFSADYIKIKKSSALDDANERSRNEVVKMQDKSNTQFFRVEKEPEIQVKDIIEHVYRSLSEKGYNPLNQIVGYIMSGDPTYITSHNNARSMVMKVERDELVEEILKEYIKVNFQ